MVLIYIVRFRAPAKTSRTAYEKTNSAKPHSTMLGVVLMARKYVEQGPARRYTRRAREARARSLNCGD